MSWEDIVKLEDESPALRRDKPLQYFHTDVQVNKVQVNEAQMN